MSRRTAQFLCAGLQHPLLFVSAHCAKWAQTDKAGDSSREPWGLLKKERKEEPTRSELEET